VKFKQPSYLNWEELFQSGCLKGLALGSESNGAGLNSIVLNFGYPTTPWCKTYEDMRSKLVQLQGCPKTESVELRSQPTTALQLIRFLKLEE
jgi:hypothetical protein